MAPAENAGYSRAVLAASRLELNLVRLLCRCEAMASEKRDPDEWRLEKVRRPHAGRAAQFLGEPRALRATRGRPASDTPLGARPRPSALGHALRPRPRPPGL